MRATGQSVEEADGLMKKFMTDNENQFISDQGDIAYKSLGQAMHPIMDALSSSHKGFQDWGGLQWYNPISLGKGGIHSLKELWPSSKQMEKLIQLMRNYYEVLLKKKKEEAEKKKKENKDE